MAKHRTRQEQRTLKVRKGNNSKVRSTKVHAPKPVYNRKSKRVDLERYLAQTNTGD